MILRQTGEWKKLNFNQRQEEIKEEKLHSRKNTDTVCHIENNVEKSIVRLQKRSHKPLGNGWKCWSELKR